MSDVRIPIVIGAVALALVAAGCTSDTSTSPSNSASASASASTSDSHGSDSEHPSFSYSGATGPENWGSLSHNYAACSNGKLQSPIDVTNPRATQQPLPVPNYKSNVGSVVNTGHNIQMSPAPGSTIKLKGKTYELEQVHAHTPAENLINGKKYNAEFHFVHGTTNGHVNESAGKTTVLAVFATVGAQNAAWEPYTSAAGLSQDYSSEEDSHFVKINWSKLIPSLKGSYQFGGSLTTPPCTEGVTWIVAPTPVTLSQQQLDSLKLAYPDNARPTQPANDRPIIQDEQ